MDDHVVKSSALPDDKVKLGTGQVVFQEEQPWVSSKLYILLKLFGEPQVLIMTDVKHCNV